MKSISPLIPVLCCVALSACKIEIEVPTSGSVTTNSSNINCAAGEVCTVDVSDIFFDETFVAQPAAGFVFTGWKQKSRGFCQGSTAPCALNTAGFAGNANLTALLNNPNEVFYLEPSFQSTGFDSLFIGHSFFKPFAEGMPFHTAQNSLTDHTQSLVFAGGPNGAPEALWNNAAKRADIQAVLNTGNVELFVMTYHPDYPTITGYRLWVDYAVAQNPNTRFAIALPWEPYPAQTNAATYESNWHDFHPTIHAGIDFLRNRHPGTDVFCIPYGQSAVELRTLFEANNLDDVDVLISSNGDAIYRDNLGHADDILVELGRLVWINALYDVDLTTYSYDPGYDADLKSIAHDIMDDHDPDYDAPYR